MNKAFDSIVKQTIGEPVKVPNDIEDVKQGLQDMMLTSVEQGLPCMDLDLPAGFRLGVPPREVYSDMVAIPKSELSKDEAFYSDLELGAAYIMMFSGLSNSEMLCLLYRNAALARQARQEYGHYGRTRIATFPAKKGMSMKGDFTELKAMIRGRNFVVVVSPTLKQQQMLRDLMETDPKICLIMINARLRCLDDRTGKKGKVKDSLALISNPVYHLRLAGKRGDGILYHELGSDWVVACRAPPSGNYTRELLKRKEEPSHEDVERAFASIGM